MAQHNEETGLNIHVPYAFEYADETEREAATGFISADVGKFARQLDDNTIWMLTATTPTWVAVGGGGVGGSGRTLISSQTPTGTGTVSFTSIPGTYTKLTIEFAARSTQSATFVAATIKLNTDATATNYRSQLIIATGAASLGSAGADDNSLGNVMSAGTSPSGSFTIGKIEIPFYANTGFNKQILAWSGNRRDASSVYEALWSNTIEWENTAAITQIDIVLGAGNYDTNTIFNLYGEP